MFLTKYHYLAILIVRDAHEKVKHNGVKETLTEIRDHKGTTACETNHTQVHHLPQT